MKREIDCALMVKIIFLSKYLCDYKMQKVNGMLEM